MSTAPNGQSEALSPWGMPLAKSVEVLPFRSSFKADISLPGSKSYTNRAIVMASIAKGVSILRAPLFSDDSYWCAEAAKALGVSVTPDKAGNSITMDNRNGGTLALVDADKLPYIGSAGTIARFLPGIIAARGRGRITLTSSSQLAKRPIAELVEALRTLGARIEMSDTGSFPLVIEGGTLVGGDVSISGKKSSQFISGLLICAPLAQRRVKITVTDHIVQSDYVRITIALMEKFGITVTVDDAFKEFIIEPQDYIGGDIELEADASTATYFLALAAATKSEITIKNLNVDTLQPDIAFVDYLEKLGCAVSKDNGYIYLKGADVLQGDKVFDFKACSDSTPALVGIAPFLNGEMEVRGVAHIRAHESDRLAVMTNILTDAGVPVVEYDDGMKISPSGQPLNHIIIDPHDDHRMAMAFAVMAAVGNGATILEPACVSKTCPDFYDLIGTLGVKCKVNS